MAGKPKLHYENARGRMEPIRWLLAAAGVEVSSEFCHFKLDWKLTTELLSDQAKSFSYLVMSFALKEKLLVIKR